MPMPRESMQDDRQLIRYLLGLLPEDEAERSTSKASSTTRWRLVCACVENDLVDAYVRGTLDGEFLRAVRVVLPRVAAPSRQSEVRRAIARRRRSRVGGGGGGAGSAANGREALAVRLVAGAGRDAAAGLWNPVPPGRSTAARVDRCAAPGRRARRPRTGSGRPARRATCRERHDQEGTRSSPRGAMPIALVLRPQTRAVGPVSVIALSPGARRRGVRPGARSAAISRGMRSRSRIPRRIASCGGATSLTPGSSRRPPAIAVTVPASLLKPQHYSLELSGRNAAGAFDIVGSYAFQIQSR